MFMFYEKKYHHNHRCKNFKSYIFLIEPMMEENESQNIPKSMEAIKDPMVYQVEPIIADEEVTTCLGKNS